MKAIERVLKGDTRKVTTEQAAYEFRQIRQALAAGEVLREAITPFHDAVKNKDMEAATDDEFALCLAVATWDKATEKP